MPNTTSSQRWSRNEGTSDVARGQASTVKRSRSSAQRASVSAETLTERAYRALEEEIVTLRLKPSQVLSEQMLSATFKIGRTPIREALQRLAREGLVAILPRKGFSAPASTLVISCSFLKDEAKPNACSAGPAPNGRPTSNESNCRTSPEAWIGPPRPMTISHSCGSTANSIAC